MNAYWYQIQDSDSDHKTNLKWSGALAQWKNIYLTHIKLAIPSFKMNLSRKAIGLVTFRKPKGYSATGEPEM